MRKAPVSCGHAQRDSIRARVDRGHRDIGQHRAGAVSDGSGNVSGGSLGKNRMADTQASNENKKQMYAEKPAVAAWLPPRFESRDRQALSGRSLVGASGNYQEESTAHNRSEHC